MTWRVLGPAEIKRGVPTWQSLANQLRMRHPIVDATFLIGAFQSLAQDPGRVHMAYRVGTDGTADTALFLESLGMGMWRALSTAQIPLAPFIANTPSDSNIPALISLMRSLPKPAFILKIKNWDPDYSPTLLDDRCESFQTHTSVRVDVSGHFADYWNGRSKNLRRSVRGLLNKLESEHLQSRLAVLQTPSEMDAAIGAHGSLEETGWKMRSGRPLSKGLIDTTFYADLLRTLATTNQARVFQLYLNDQLVASQFGIISGATLALLKTGYNDAFARFAPGRVLDYLMLQHLFECHDVERVEYCTIATEDDVRWSTAQRGIFEFYVYRNAMTKRAVWIARKAKGVLRALRHRQR